MDTASIFMFGVQKQDDADLAAAKLGQSGGVLPKDVRDVMLGEESHLVYQVASRVARTIIDGMAAPATAWLIHAETALQERLKFAMPEVDYNLLTVEHKKCSRDAVRKAFAMGDIKDALGSLREDDELPMFLSDFYKSLDPWNTTLKSKSLQRYVQEAISAHPKRTLEGRGRGRRIVRA